MISFVYFDVGGVVMLDFNKTNKWYEMKHDLGVPDDKMELFDSIWNRYPIAIDCDVELLIFTIGKEIGIQIPPDYSMLEDFAHRFTPNPSIWLVIEQIHKKCRVGLLTNMYPRMLNLIQSKNLLPRVQWDVIIDSSVVKLKKPDPRIYTLAQDRAHVSGTNIFFVENQEHNIAAAKAAGWRTFLYDTSEPEQSSRDVLDFFQRHSKNTI